MTGFRARAAARAAPSSIRFTALTRLAGLLTVLCAVGTFAQSVRVVLRWKPSAGAVRYQVQIAKDQVFGTPVLDQVVTEPAVKWEELPQVHYWWRVRSYDAEGRASEWSAPRMIGRANAAPAAKSPEDGAIVGCSDAPVAFELEPSELMRGYQVEASLDPRFPLEGTKISSDKSSSLALVLPPGLWHWRTRGTDVQGRPTEPSASRKLSVRLLAPKLKDQPDVALSAQQLTLSWSAVPCAKRYQVEIRGKDKEPVRLEATESQTQFKPSELGEWRWRVTALDPAGQGSEPSLEDTFFVKTSPPVPRAEVLGAASEKGREVELPFAAAPGTQASAFTVEVGKGEGNSFGQTLQLSQSPARLTLPPGRWRWRVSAKDDKGRTSLPSDVRRFVISDVPPPPAPTVLEPAAGALVHGGFDGPLTVKLEPLAAAARYEAMLDDRAPVQSDVPVLTLERVSEGEHTLKVRALARGGVPGPWTTVVFTRGLPKISRVAISGLEPLPADGKSTLQLDLLFFDRDENEVSQLEPKFEVTGAVLVSVSAPEPNRSRRRLVIRAPDEAVEASLLITERGFTFEQRIDLEPTWSQLMVFGAVGARFNGGAVASFAGHLGFTARPRPFKGFLVLETRVGFYTARADVPLDDGSVLRGSAVVVPVSLLAGGWYDFGGAWSAKLLVGAAVQPAGITLGAASTSGISLAFDVSATVGRKLGPGAVEVTADFLAGGLFSPLAQFQAGGLALLLGYRFDL